MRIIWARPAFVTDTTGAVLWDAGITTPFGVSIETQAIGDSVQTTAAPTQPIMFPGQYRDEETGYDDNWHRTYDPALGRYLQSDPIGLRGGLNRYAYVGGNPVGRIDPDGRFWWGIGFAAADLAWQLYQNGGRLKCVDYLSVGLNFVGGGFVSKAFRKVLGKEFSHWIPDRFIRTLTLSKKGPNDHYKPLVDKYLNRFVNSRFNGNYVKPKFHSVTDDYHFLKGMTKEDNWPKYIQQVLRVPGWIPGGALLGAAAVTDFSDVECSC